MKKQWHIRTRVLFTLVGLTAAILLAVGLAFNLAVRGYVRSRVVTQLANVSESATSDRRVNMPAQHDKPSDAKSDERPDAPPSERPDRFTGATGSAVVLRGDGSLVAVLRGDGNAAPELAAYFSANGFDENRRYQTLSLGDEKYAVSVTDDPVQAGCYLVSYVNVTAILGFAARINTVLLVIIFAAIALSVVLSRIFAKSFAAPVQELSAFAREIGGGDFSARDLRFHDVEFGQLAFSMNQMASELREAKQKQEVFFQNVSHELRTPLTSIRGNAEGIVCGVMEPLSAAKVILSESDKLGSMVEDILYLSRMGKAAPEGEANPLDLREVLDLCASEQRAAADGKGVAFRFDFDDAPVVLSIREQDAQRLFGNLISNAIRYAKSEVALACRAEGDAVLVRVSDDGEGISEDDLPHIFERFYKGKGGKHGIGLAIAQSVAAAYHGTLSARSDGGAVFEARFPLNNKRDSA
ncbi:MAG: HAMP domain-containing histidine kinase [Oscillospiraceae bacterium]|nr:HAMP domain-containing histidine kinase [Oscillospiraceae bacterium]